MNILFGHAPDWAIELKAALSPRHRIEISRITNYRSIDDFDCVVPILLDEVSYLYRFFGEHAGSKFLAPKPNIADLCDDKLRFGAFLLANGFGDYVPRFGSSIGYPCILKKRRDAYGKNSRILLESSEAFPFHPADYFRQECVYGNREYATHFLAIDGDIVFDYSREYLCKDDLFVKGKYYNWDNGMIGSCAVPTPAIDVFADIVRALRYSGFGCFDYKLERGAPKIFELNPRCGFTLHYCFEQAISVYRELLVPALSAGRAWAGMNS